jgi:hypothetical protein
MNQGIPGSWLDRTAREARLLVGGLMDRVLGSMQSYMDRLVLAVLGNMKGP